MPNRITQTRVPFQQRRHILFGNIRHLPAPVYEPDGGVLIEGFYAPKSGGGPFNIVQFDVNSKSSALIDFWSNTNLWSNIPLFRWVDERQQCMPDGAQLEKLMVFIPDLINVIPQLEAGVKLPRHGDKEYLLSKLAGEVVKAISVP